MLFVLMGSQVCYAAAKQEVVTEIPQQIIVEGGGWNLLVYRQMQHREL